MNNIFPYTGDEHPLTGEYVYLEPAREGDRETMRPLAKDERIWEFTKTLLINEDYDAQFDRYFDEALALQATGAGQAFIIRAKQPGLRYIDLDRYGASVSDEEATGPAIGMTRLYAIDWKEGRVEIGHTWYIPAVWGKVHNKECKLLLLQYLFETKGFNRVEFRVAHQNVRSQKAVAKIGGVREGELRQFMRRNDGVWRNSVIFSILNEEWPEKKVKLKAMV